MSANVLHKLSAYRLEVESIDDLSFAKHVEVESRIWQSGKMSFPYRLFFFKDVLKTASWFPAFSQLNITKKDIPKTKHAGFILLVKVGSAFYGVTGGLSHVYLRKAAEIAFQFGIELAKRILTHRELRSLAQKDTGGNVNSLDRHFRGIYNPTADINNLRRVLTNVRGKLSKKKNPLYAEIGSSIQAGDALGVNGAKTFDEIMEFLSAVETLWIEGKDKFTIPSLERLNKKVHAKLMTELEDALIAQITSYQADDPQLLFLDSENRSGFDDHVATFDLALAHSHLAATSVDEVFGHARDWFVGIAGDDAKRDAFHRMRLHIVFDDDVKEDGALFDYICGDVVYDNDVFFLVGKNWYRASDAFVKAVGAQLDNIECIDPGTIGLHKWDKNRYADEDAFNASHSNLVLLDRRLVKLPGENGIEFCDLLGHSADKVELIHVKEANGAALRALFAQGSVSGTLYSESNEFRKMVQSSEFTNRAGIANLTSVQKAELSALNKRQMRELKIVFAIFDTTESHVVPPGATLASKVLDGTLSTFAKVDLLNHCQTLRGMGFDVAVARIRPYPAAKVKGKATKKTRK